MRRVGPVNEHADHRIVDRPEFADRLVRTGQVSVHHVGRSAQLPKRRDQLVGRLARLRKRPLVGLGAIVSGPEDRDFLGHGVLGPCFFGLDARHSPLANH